MATAFSSVDLSLRTRLGIQLLAGTPDIPRDPARGARHIFDAAEQGDAEALHLAAVFAAAGACRAQSWSDALDCLQHSAERGWGLARAQLELLSADRALASDADAPERWRRLREAIDVTAWTTPPARQPLSEAPRIRRFERFASPETCAWLMERARGRLALAQVYDATSGEAASAATRTNREADFNIVESDVVLLLLRARIAAAASLPPAVLELTKVLHYDVGQGFAPHYDFLDPAVPGFAAELAARGQRLATLLLYLSDDYEGGETEFARIGLRHRGRAGDALLFANVDRAGAPDRQTLHAGCPPTRGEKWLLSQWMRDRVPPG